MNPTIRGFIKKELTQASRDPRMRILMFVMPVIQMTLFGLALTNEVRNIRLAGSFPPSDTASRRFAERCLASGWFVKAKSEGPDPLHWLRSGQAEAVLIAPAEGISKGLRRGGAQLQVLIDASNAVRARSIETYLNAVLQEEAAAQGLAPKTPPFSLNVRMLYNPAMVSSIFMVPGVLCLILCIITIQMTSMSMAREKELGTFETLIASPATPREILIGKTLPYVLLGSFVLPLVMTVAMVFFGVPLRGPAWQLLLGSVAFLSSTVSVGFLIASYARSQQQAMMGGFLFLFPAIQMSGIMFPVENMPDAIAWVGYLNPIRYFVTLLRHIMLKGGDLRVFAFNGGMLLLLGGAAILLAARRFRQTLD